MSAVKDEILRLLDELPDEELNEVATVVRGRAELHARTTLQAHEHVSAAPGHAPAGPVLRWPHLGPVAVGTAILLGWGVGIIGGPLLAGVGAAVGLVVGDRLDQRTVAADV